MLNEQSIRETLERIVNQLSEGDAESANFAIEDLGLDRLTQPIEDRSKHRMFVDPAAAFGVDKSSRSLGPCESLPRVAVGWRSKTCFGACEPSCRSLEQGRVNTSVTVLPRADANRKGRSGGLCACGQLAGRVSGGPKVFTDGFDSKETACT